MTSRRLRQDHASANGSPCTCHTWTTNHSKKHLRNTSHNTISTKASEISTRSGNNETILSLLRDISMIALSHEETEHDWESVAHTLNELIAQVYPSTIASTDTSPTTDLRQGLSHFRIWKIRKNPEIQKWAKTRKNPKIRKNPETHVVPGMVGVVPSMVGGGT